MLWGLVAPGVGPLTLRDPDYCTEARSLFARLTTAPTGIRKALINNLIVSLKLAGVWAKLDTLHVMAAADAQAAQRNWVADAYNLTETSSPTFTANAGYTPNGTASYLDTGFNPTTASSPKFTLNDAHMGVWHLTDLANSGAISFDVGNGNSRMVNNAALATVPRPNNTNTTGIAEDYAKHKCWTRSASNVWEYYNDGADAGGGKDASTALSNFNFGYGRTVGGSHGVNQICVGHWGTNLTASEVLAAKNAFSAYLIGVGAI